MNIRSFLRVISISCIWPIAVWISVFLLPNKVLAQGVLAVTPISAYTSNAQQGLKSSIQNLTNKSVKFEIVLECDVDGELLKEKECEKYFKFATDALLKPDGYELGAKERAIISVALQSSVNSYALFRPLIRPLIVKENQVKNGISFEFNFRPGFLFLIKPAEEQLVVQSFETKVTETSRVASFKFDIEKFKSPHVANVSAKLLNSSTKKLVRFARLAEDKIVDPRRKVLELQVEYARLQDPDEKLCYEIFIHEKTEGAKLHKSTNCQN